MYRSSASNLAKIAYKLDLEGQYSKADEITELIIRMANRDKIEIGRGIPPKTKEEGRKLFPILSELLDNNTMWLDGSTYFGIASDGTEVAIGVEGEEQAAEEYLKHCPTPDMW